MDALRLEAEERRLEEGLGRAEALVADGDDLAVGQLVRLLERRRLRRGDHLLLEVECHVAQLLLDVTDDLALGGRREGVAALHQLRPSAAARPASTDDLDELRWSGRPWTS